VSDEKPFSDDRWKFSEGDIVVTKSDGKPTNNPVDLPDDFTLTNG
jgi:hypothetical protein